MQVRVTTKISGRMMLTVIEANRWNQLAPSSSAASYSSGSTRCSAAMKTTTGYPICTQTSTTMSTSRAEGI